MGSEEIDIRDKVIFPRSFISTEMELLNELEKNGALSIQTKEDLKEIMNWPQKIQPVHRKVIQTTYEDFQNNHEKYKLFFKNIFLKTAKKSHTHCVLKDFGYIDLEGEKYFITNPKLWDVSLKDPIFLSNAFESIKDEENNMDCKEYRVFVLNNSLLSISRSYVDYPTEIPNEVILFVEYQIEKISSVSNFPSNFVLDVRQILMDGKEVIDIIEFNPISSSCLEVCNHLVDELVKLEQTPQFAKKRLTKKY